MLVVELYSTKLNLCYFCHFNNLNSQTVKKYYICISQFTHFWINLEKTHVKSSHAVTKAVVHAVFTATHCYCPRTDLHIKHQQKSLLPHPPKHPTLSHPQQKLPGASSDLKNAFLVGSIYKMQRSEQAKCLYR